ncbi:hypothetical protein DAPPUDRAFT_103788 [Daphnia pulex]|uniref:Uncharacterized protein n=1 Tax=Daphnia pulex TaxID=6669 RepID=E9GKA0_DAPPU|nr:hypothetical protein DAPPUDRAFT_103788 [Daphnia pulex]|eukprot:EFX79950.1 hypothetical protein DAPPUDRAFT_103788 [Daphnia pulex]
MKYLISNPFGDVDIKAYEELLNRILDIYPYRCPYWVVLCHFECGEGFISRAIHRSFGEEDSKGSPSPFGKKYTPSGNAPDAAAAGNEPVTAVVCSFVEIAGRRERAGRGNRAGRSERERCGTWRRSCFFFEKAGRGEGAGQGEKAGHGEDLPPSDNLPKPGCEIRDDPD